MNKDLDDRIVPNGEYRDAVNVTISQSESGDVGAVENVRGNIEKLQIDTNITFIGSLADDVNNVIYIFGTDNTSENAATGICGIYRYNATANTVVPLVKGIFLNFSTLYPMHGINLLENLLFFTDNRNQPRVIDVDKALANPATDPSPYYTKEEHLSVAKYAPYEAIDVYYQTTGTANGTSGGNFKFGIAGNTTDIKVGDYCVNTSTGVFLGIVNNIVVGTNASVTVDKDISAILPVNGNKIQFTRTTMSDQSGNASWGGDPDFIEEKFIRLSYRFKYEDNTYSLMAPYTQTLFIPKQRGFFTYDTTLLSGDEEAAYESTIVSFMENLINNVELYVPLPSSDIAIDYKIKEVEIIYTESDSNIANVLQSVPVATVQANIETTYKPEKNYFKFVYQSQKPFKTLTTAETTRVADKVPVKALAQEIISNRVVYGNFVDRRNSPQFLDYNIAAQERDLTISPLAASYPQHSLKQNRNYQVGVVLTDKYGRASDVILSEDITGISEFPASTLFHPYREYGWAPGVANWIGDSLRIIFNSVIPDDDLYAIPQTFTLNTAQTGTTIVSTTYTIIGLDVTSTVKAGEYLRAKQRDFTKVVSSTLVGSNTVIVTEEEISSVYLYTGGYPATGTQEPKYVYTLDQTGWYSYKIVIKQTEQDYYNVYLPGIINGNPIAPLELNRVANIVLHSDNINKIPRDLSEVGPDQDKYRSSSIRLYGRVNNTTTAFSPTYNQQLYLGRIDNFVTQIATETDFFASEFGASGYVPFAGFYNVNSNPLLAKIDIFENNAVMNIPASSIPPNVGVSAAAYAIDTNTLPQLAVFETEATESRLDIYWESSTAGLIADLNELIVQSFDGVAGVSSFNSVFNESNNYDGTPSGLPITTSFNPVDGAGTAMTGTTATINNIVDGNGTSVVNDNSIFELDLISTGPDVYKINCKQDFAYLESSSTSDVYTFTLKFVSASLDISYHDISVELLNNNPSLGSSLANQTIFLGDTEISGTIQPILNGAATNTDAQLVLEIDSQTMLSPSAGTSTTAFGTSLTDQGSFQSGKITVVDETQLTAGDIYSVTYKVSDANKATGFLTDSDTVQITIANPVTSISTNTGTSQWIYKGGFVASTGSIYQKPIIPCSSTYPGKVGHRIQVNNIYSGQSNIPGLGQTGAFTLAMQIVTATGGSNNNWFDPTSTGRYSTTVPFVDWFKFDSDDCTSLSGTAKSTYNSGSDPTKRGILLDASEITGGQNITAYMLFEDILLNKRGAWAFGTSGAYSYSEGYVSIKFVLKPYDPTGTYITDRWDETDGYLIASGTLNFVGYPENEDTDIPPNTVYAGLNNPSTVVGVACASGTGNPGTSC
jgi:hypothetical protein